MTRSGPRRIPVATYRLQLHREFGLGDAARLVEYLHALGVTDAYLSPSFRARPGSRHGYDVVDHGSLNPELGGEEGFAALRARAEERGMGLIMDLVPNHMCVTSPENSWWTDVLENGPSSPFARYFDVDWLPPKADLVDKVLLPLLGEQYGRVLENQELKVAFVQGAFQVEYYDHRLPVAPRAWPVVLGPLLERLKAERGEGEAAVLELESILTAIAHLPLRSETAPERVRERQREKEVIKRRLAALVASTPAVETGLASALTEINGRQGDPHSFDRLEALLAEQAYRLSYWRVASDEINYRRFFDVNELAALRVEEPEVFEALHALPQRLAREGAVQGLRIDHVDGLFDPSDYLDRLPDGAYVVVEKILIGDERLREDWPVQGTTGYDFLNLLGGLLVDGAGRRELESVYGRFTGIRDHARDVAYECRKLVLDVSMSSEITVLARKLDRISEQHRFSRDFTLNSLQAALGEVIACFPVYRTYVRATGPVAPQDRRHIETAVRLAKRRNPATSESLFDFVASVLLLDDPDGLDEAQRRERRDFAMRFQQLTGPVMAKGLEDTASYRLHPLASLNEVGSELGAPPASVERFHRVNAARRRAWPHTLNATSTHDTKRDEDVRARIGVLSEVPNDFGEALGRWLEIARPHRSSIDDVEAPDPNAEYLLYQTLVGTWPTGLAGGAPPAEYVERIQAYMRKALREAKLHTSWVSPNQPYEGAVDRFVAALLDPSSGREFLRDFSAFLRPVLRPGLLSAISQVLLKIASPGVPDFYQGTELWEFHLVDPDNRGPVDFDRRRRLLEQLDAPGAAPARRARELLEQIEDGRLKLFVTSRALRFRRRRHELFRDGDYVPLAAEGEGRPRAVAFARSVGDEVAIAMAGRLFAGLPARPLGRAAWGEAAVALGPVSGSAFRDVFTEQEVRSRPGAHGPELPLAEVFAHLPFAMLESVR